MSDDSPVLARLDRLKEAVHCAVEEVTKRLDAFLDAELGGLNRRAGDESAGQRKQLAA